MRRKLSKHGNSLALVIEKPVLDLLGINADTELEVTTDGNRLIVFPASSEDYERKFEEAVAFVFDRYDKTLAKLAK
jgi:antitoxin component of MazEF toxin-antitoxin module